MGTDYRAILKSAKKVGDTVVLLSTILIILAVIGFVALSEGGAIEYLFLGLIVLGISLFVVRVIQITILGNALRVQNGRHSYLVDMVNEVATNLKMPYVDVFIAQDPYLNAFAIGYTHPYTIVLNSAIVEHLSKEELKAVLIHEMAHIKYKHTFILAYTQPLHILIPVLGPIIGWVFGFWGRRAEMASDRLALAYTRDPHTVIMALIKIHVGAKFAEYMQEEGVLYQEKISKGAMKMISQSFSSHPFLVTRVHEVLAFSQKLGLVLPTTVPLPPSAEKAVSRV